MQAVGRRTLLKTAAAGIAAAISPAAFGALAPPDARLKLNLGQSGATIPADFTGLSYESSQLAHPSFFSAQNTSLIQLFRTLGERGVLRIGGNMSEFTVWSPVDTDVTTAGETEGPDPGKGSDRTFTITPRAIQNLAEFLNAVNWRLIYGLNLAKGTPESATEEASCVAKKIGARLLAFQFGNEPDLFKQAGQGSPHWTYDQFIAKWQMFSKAVRQRLPGIPLAGPDTSFKPDWVERFTADTKGEVALLTTHYYAEGPPTDPRMTIDYLLHPGERFATHILEAISVARRVGLPYRMAEGNSCYAAGKKGVSDTFASALWVADFMLSVAQAGGTGVNLHGGGDGLYTHHRRFVVRRVYGAAHLLRHVAGRAVCRSPLRQSGSRYRGSQSGRIRSRRQDATPDCRHQSRAARCRSGPRDRR